MKLNWLSQNRNMAVLTQSHSCQKCLVFPISLRIRKQKVFYGTVGPNSWPSLTTIPPYAWPHSLESCHTSPLSWNLSNVPLSLSNRDLTHSAASSYYPSFLCHSVKFTQSPLTSTQASASWDRLAWLTSWVAPPFLRSTRLLFPCPLCFFHMSLHSGACPILTAPQSQILHETGTESVWNLLVLELSVYFCCYSRDKMDKSMNRYVHSKPRA